MRVAFITTDGRDLLKNYASTVPDFGTAPQALLQGFAQLPEVEVHVVSLLQQPVRSPEKLADNIFFHSLLVPKIGWLRTGYQGCIRAVRKKLKEIQPDIVHGQGTERDCAISAAISGHPNVITIHGNMAELARRFKAPAGSYVWLAGKLENFVLKRTGGVFCNSAYTEGLVGPRAKKTWRVPNALRAEFFGPQPPPPAARCQLLNIGVITPRKRQLELLDAVERLRSAGVDFHFRFVGDAPAADDYARAFLEKIRPLEAAGVASHFAPMQTTELVAEFDRNHAVVHFPSEEAFGLVVAESLARGCQFFGARTGGIVDITAGVAGAELYEVNDWTGLIAGITAWMRNGFGRSADGARQMRDRYSPEVVARRHLEIYREVLNIR
jgi:glycosyltransferase involved in cell wall biosynthesis